MTQNRAQPPDRTTRQRLRRTSALSIPIPRRGVETRMLRVHADFDAHAAALAGAQRARCAGVVDTDTRTPGASYRSRPRAKKATDPAPPRKGFELVEQGSPTRGRQLHRAPQRQLGFGSLGVVIRGLTNKRKPAKS